MRMRWIERQTKSTVVLQLKDGQSMRGVFIRAYSDCLVLHHATYLSPSGDVQVDGEVIVPRPNVSWIQVINNSGVT